MAKKPVKSIKSRIVTVFLFLILVMLWTRCSPDVTDSNPNPNPNQGSFLANGCWLSSVNGSFPNNSGLLPSTGNPALDQAFTSEGGFLTAQFGVFPRGWFFDDSSSPNAYATPEVTNPAYPDGTVVLGLNLLQAELYRDGGAGFAVPAILAHEVGHIVQFKRGPNPSGKINELHADFLAGWYMYRRGFVTFTDIRPALASFFSKGDYNFNDPGHHGTPEQRLAAVQYGLTYGFEPFNQAYNDGLQIVMSFDLN